MHESVMAWVKHVIKCYELVEASVLEVGSLNINGSVRGLFKGPYLGIDKLAGPGVDRVADGNSLPLEDETFDVVVCTEVLSHDPRFWLTVGEIARVLRQGGYLILTVRGLGFGRNDSPCDYYRFTRDAIISLLGDAGLTLVTLGDDCQLPGIFALAKKGTQ